MSLAMTKEEREAFLADIHMAVISVAEDGHAPLAVASPECACGGSGS
jgi:hypothetical protein